MEPKTLQAAIVYFADPVNCREYLVARRWPDGVVCPRCGSTNVLFLEKYNRWHCRQKHPAPQFTLKTGTIFEDSPLGLDKWLTAMWMIVNSKNGVSSWEMSRTLGTTQKSAWFMMHRIREAMTNGTIAKLGGSGGGPVEVDEAFIGGTPKFMHAKRRMSLGTGIGGRTAKVPVMGMLDRERRQVRAQVVPNVKRETLQNAILKEIETGSTIYTDNASTFDTLAAKDYVHDTVNHIEEYVRGQVHTQGIENFWSLLKRGLRGTYVAVEPFHLSKYVDEQIFRYNHRIGYTDSTRFQKALEQVAGKRLTWNDLTGKEDAPEAF